MLRLSALARPTGLLGSYLVAAFTATSTLFFISRGLNLRGLPTEREILVGWLVFLAALALLSGLPVAQAHSKPQVRDSAMAAAVVATVFVYGVIDVVMTTGRASDGVLATVFVAAPMLGILFASSVLKTEWGQVRPYSPRVLAAVLTFAISLATLAGAIGAILILE